VGHWELTDSQINKFREYLMRGGFFMCDDFHGTNEWEVFVYTMQKVFPDRKIVDLPEGEQIFHTVFDLDERYQVQACNSSTAARSTKRMARSRVARHLRRQRPRDGGHLPQHGSGRLLENADDPAYPEKFSALGVRIGINYVIYAMTH